MDKWKVKLHRNVEKHFVKLPEKVTLVMQVLVEELSIKGPSPGQRWSNYSKLRGRKTKDIVILLKEIQPMLHVGRLKIELIS